MFPRSFRCDTADGLPCHSGTLPILPINLIILPVIKELKKENVEFVVAPYDADAQLAYLERKGVITTVLTEDSDLLVFGCKNVVL